MPQKAIGYQWEKGQPLPVLEAHSQAKHKVIDFYLRRYLNVLLADPRRDRLRLFLIDGFAGGGLYQSEDGRHELPGSPLILANAVAETVAEIGSNRRKQPVVETNLYLIEKAAPIVEHLRGVVNQRGLNARPHLKTHILNGSFLEQLDAVLRDIQSHGFRMPRAIFFLDQYGYKDVPLAALRKIFSSLPGAEVVLTFATDALINYMSDDPSNRLTLAKMGLEAILDATSVDEIKERDMLLWRNLIQSELHKSLSSQSGASNFTPFFIKSQTSRRSYWLVHLSNHVRARDEMCEVHWALNNHFSHHAGAGLDMLGFDPRYGSLQQLNFGFDGGARDLSIATLMEQLPRLPELEDGITWDRLFEKHANHTPATAAMIKQSLHTLERQKEIIILSPAKRRRSAAEGISNGDFIARHKTLHLDLFPTSSNIHQRRLP